MWALPALLVWGQAGGGSEGGQPGQLGRDLITEELYVLLRTQAFPRSICGILRAMSLMSKTFSMSGPWQYVSEGPVVLSLKVLPVRITAGESVRAATCLDLQFKTVTRVAVR